MRIKLLSCFLFFGFTQVCPAQSFKMGGYTEEDLALEQVPYEKDAHAVVLAEFGTTRFSGDYVETLYFFRRKILDDAGKEYGDIRIRYYSGDQRIEEISGIKAQTINQINGEIEEIKVSKDAIFSVDLENGMKEYRISFPNVQPGSILEYQFKKIDKNKTFLDGWTFQNSIPTLFSQYQITLIPELEYQIILQGNKLVNDVEKSSNNGVLTWAVRNLYASKEEPFMKNYRDYVERI